jgi:hypothetical protein
MLTPLLLLSALSTGTVDLALGPATQSAPVGSTIEVTLTASAATAEGVTAIDAILSWDPAELQFLEADASLQPWFIAGFLPDPDGINASIADGEALYTVLSAPGSPAGVPPDLDAVLFRFQVLGSGTISLKPSSGTFAKTRVLGLLPGEEITGGLSGPAAVLLAPTNYCTAGVSANGCASTLSAVGLASASASSGFTVTANALEGARSGTFFMSSNGRQANPWGNGTSFQCVVPPVHRAGVQLASGTPGQCDGAIARDLNALWCASCPKPAKNPGAGALVQIQLWYRDPQNTSNQTTSMSDALEFTVGP